jgi:phage major head subunit gpT-like protein
MGTIVRTAALAALQTGLNLQYASAYESPRPLIYKDVCSEIPSGKKNVLLAIADMFPQMRQWVGDRVFHNPAEHSQLLTNPHYELSMEVDADDVEDDELGGYFLSSAGLGERASQHPDVLLGQVLQTGQTLIGFDGQNFFDTAHPIDAKNHIGTQSNYEAAGRALTAANWELVKANMASWSAGPSNGGVSELIGSVPTHVMVPRQLEGVAKRIFEAELDASIVTTAAQTNVNKGTAKIIVNDRLNNQPTTWYALDLRSVLKPFAFVKRKAPKFVMLNRPDDQGMFLNNKIQFGVDGRWGVGIAAWFRAYKAAA